MFIMMDNGAKASQMVMERLFSKTKVIMKAHLWEVILKEAMEYLYSLMDLIKEGYFIKDLWKARENLFHHPENLSMKGFG